MFIVNHFYMVLGEYKCKANTFGTERKPSSPGMNTHTALSVGANVCRCVGALTTAD